MTDFSRLTACGGCCDKCPKKQDRSCPGCLEADGRVPEWAESGRCRIHVCTREHRVPFCGLCGEFPCEQLPQLVSWNPDIVEQMTALRNEYRRIVQIVGENYAGEWHQTRTACRGMISTSSRRYSFPTYSRGPAQLGQFRRSSSMSMIRSLTGSVFMISS